MGENKNFYRDVLYNSMVGYAYHKIIFNQLGEPCDYEFIEVNPAFEKYTDLKAENILGKRVTDILPDIQKDEFHWIKVYGEIALNGGVKSFENYSLPLKRCYRITAYSPEKYYFVTTITEISQLEKEVYDSQRKIRSIMEDLRLILDSTGEAIYGIDIEGKCTFCNKSCLTLLGYSDEKELIGKTMHNLIHYKDIDGKPILEEECLICQKFKEGKGAHIKGDIFWKKDGSYIFVDCLSYPKKSNGKLVGGVIAFIDVSETKKTEDELKESERSKSLLLSNLPGMAYRCDYDREWTMRFVSEGCYELTGYKPESILNNRDISFNDLIDTYYQDVLWQKWNKALKNRSNFKEEYEIVTASGKKKWVLEQGQGVYSGSGKVEAIEGLIIDITDRKQKENEINYLSNNDFMTGLYNRRYFEKAKYIIDREQFYPISVIMGDINGVKFINDALGHEEGDKVIIKTARLLKCCCREEDIVSRTGGDEFVLLLPKTDKKAVTAIIKRIQEKFDFHNKNITNDDYYISIALGSSTKEDKQQSIDNTIKKAEDNMYKYKLLEHKSSHGALISSIKSTMFERSQETEEHAERLAELAQRMGAELNLSLNELQEITLLATLHDIGKIGVDNQIINKPYSLSEKEWEEMKNHSEIGYRIAMASSELATIAIYILHHHERWDGTGYPRGLRNSEIPLPSRIISIVDAFDAMTSDRPYRKAMTREAALNEIRINAGKQFDPGLVKVFLEKVVI